ncbi:MAG: hypothetical protein KGJ62_09320 [Armatimonadetes bacterium]|nr:hypothetical protein [Armatimonadota bacterium]MDE2207444.1 hypothetical protein [Armatimonadota bacterium]
MSSGPNDNSSGAAPSNAIGFTTRIFIMVATLAVLALAMIQTVRIGKVAALYDDALNDTQGNLQNTTVVVNQMKAGLH